MRSVKDTIVAWNPGTDQVKLFPWPDYERASKDYRLTGFAAYSHIQEMDFEQRKCMAFITAAQLIIRNECDPRAVHSALWELEEYRDGCDAGWPLAQ